MALEGVVGRGLAQGPDLDRPGDGEKGNSFDFFFEKRKKNESEFFFLVFFFFRFYIFFPPTLPFSSSPYSSPIQARRRERVGVLGVEAHRHHVVRVALEDLRAAPAAPPVTGLDQNVVPTC